MNKANKIGKQGEKQIALILSNLPSNYIIF